MSCPRAPKGKRGRRRINFLLKHPNWKRARESELLRKHLDQHDYLTPNFSVTEMADTETHRIPCLRAPARNHCWNLERFSYALAAAGRAKVKRIEIRIDGPSRTRRHNEEVGGAKDSQHMHCRASDHFTAQVMRWVNETGLSKNQIIQIAQRYFTAIGNETSGTLHFDSRPGRPGSVMFVHWMGEGQR